MFEIINVYRSKHKKKICFILSGKYDIIATKTFTGNFNIYQNGKKIDFIKVKKSTFTSKKTGMEVINYSSHELHMTRVNIKDLSFVNKIPVYNSEIGSYVAKFSNKLTISSCKNAIFIDDNKNIVEFTKKKGRIHFHMLYDPNKLNFLEAVILCLARLYPGNILFRISNRKKYYIKKTEKEEKQHSKYITLED